MNTPLSDNNEPVSQRNSRENLERLLNRMIEAPEQRDEIAEQIDDIFGQDKAVMILDMSGFSRTTQHLGIIQFLLMIHQMQLIARPCVQEYHGLILKAEADNLYCLFDSVAEAVRASRDIVERLNAANLLLPEGRRLYVSIGIGYGHILNVEDNDLFGNEVNLASKLGEDIGDMGEILLTTNAYAQIRNLDIPVEEEEISISGLALPYYRVA
jgi:class 3 adenylate cyclase